MDLLREERVTIAWHQQTSLNRKRWENSEYQTTSRRNARNSKRRELQMLPDKTKVSASPMIEAWDENTPEGLQIKFFLIAAVKLAWRGNEGASCLTHYFQKETGNDDTSTGRIQYNHIFTKTTQGGAKPYANNKWLEPNHDEVSRCPVRLLDKLMIKRSKNVNTKTDRLFLTVNPNWRKAKICQLECMN
ncbi:hypothetical protein FQR65_LT06577 [Abscondita terminalis]|nr:hypothetical protein FQR65_LT06577 [Abscondita terminalis]